MTGKDRVWAAINREELDHVPVGAEMKYFTAHHYGVSFADYLVDYNLQLELQHKIFDELGGADFVIRLHPCYDAPQQNTVRRARRMPGMKILSPGIDLPPDSIPQYSAMADHTGVQSVSFHTN